MNFTLNEEQLAVREAARDFTQRVLKPGVIERDKHMTYPTEEVRQMGELGFMGMMVDPKYGGGGMDSLSYVIALEEMSKIDNSCSVIASVNNSLVCYGLEHYGTDEQKDKYLRKLATGEWVGAFCLSEPEAGSDATSQRTTAVDMGDHYLLNGTKNWITNGGTSSLHLVVAQTDPEKGHRGINCLIVEADWDGVEIGAKEDKLGIRSSDTHTIMYSDVKVPKPSPVAASASPHRPSVLLPEPMNWPLPTPKSGKPSESPSPSTRPLPLSWPRWPPISKPPGCSFTAPPGSKMPEWTTTRPEPWPSFTPAASP